jgi:hypothetical protein
MARLADGSAQNVTDLATWTSSDTVTATVSPSGFVRVLKDGTTEIRVAYGDVTGSSLVSVSFPQFPLTGLVMASGLNGGPIAGAEVRILESEINGNPALTAANGAFAFPGLAVGRHLIEVTKDGFQTVEMEVVVTDGAVQTTVTLDRVHAAGQRP